MVIFLACGAGDRVKPGVERGGAEPQEYGAINSIKPAERAAAFCYSSFHFQ
jgi:hypothetical protein